MVLGEGKNALRDRTHRRRGVRGEKKKTLTCLDRGEYIRRRGAR